MTKGTLIIRGFFSASKFYPTGSSDADTVRVTIATASFLSDGGEHSIYGNLQRARYVENKPDGTRGYTPVMQGGAIKVRLQGIDAPELHYQAFDLSFRQPRGAYAARRTGEGLRFYGGDWQPCEVVTRVSYPAQGFDVYGRMIGDLIYGAGPDRRNLNLQLLREGLALPSIYDSMDADEILAVLEASRIGMKATDTIWAQWSPELSFDPTLLAPGQPGSVVPEPDLGPVILPKLFRRLSTHIQGGGTLEGFRDVLAAGQELVRRTEDVLQGNGIAPVPFADFVDSRPAFTVGPADLVFLERPSELFLEASPGTYVPWK